MLRVERLQEKSCAPALECSTNCREIMHHKGSGPFLPCLTRAVIYSTPSAVRSCKAIGHRLPCPCVLRHFTALQPLSLQEPCWAPWAPFALGREGCLNSRSTQSKSMGPRTSGVPPVPAVRFVSGQNAPAGKRTSRPTRRLHDASWTACWYCSWLWGAGAACGAAFLAMKQVAGKPAWAKLRSRKRSQQDWPVPGLSFPASTTPQHGLSLARCGQYEFAEV